MTSDSTDEPVLHKGSTADFASVISERWLSEARRCWSVGSDGGIPGFIADLAERTGPMIREEERPWRRLSGEASKGFSAPQLHSQADAVIYYYSKKEARDNPDVCKKDFAMALQFFNKGQSGSCLLDLGCGDALMARRFVQSGCFGSVFAVDTSWQQLEAARRAAEEERISPEDGLFLARADAQALPFCEGQVDYAWWGLGMHVVKDPAAALQNLFKCLRPGGLLLATTRSDGFIPHQLGRMMAEAGFVDVALRVPRHTVYAIEARRPV